MKDGYGREITYLRISITDKCNLRCGYCMPEEGIKHLSHDDVLTLEELKRLVSIMTDLGIRRVRITGGEPLVRKGVLSLIEMLHEEKGLDEIVMTSNGCLLSEYALDLKRAGLGGINVSLDTLRSDTYRHLTGRDELGNVLNGIDKAVQAGVRVGLNCVPIKGINEDDIVPLAVYAQKNNTGLRFIELMPIGCGALYTGIRSEEILERLRQEFGQFHIADPQKYGSGRGPAIYYGFERYNGLIGFISPISHKFCEECDRLRLTAEGFLKLCLQYPDGADLKTPLRNGASDEDIKLMINDAVRLKPGSHSFADDTGADSRKMVQIGG